MQQREPLLKNNKWILRKQTPLGARNSKQMLRLEITQHDRSSNKNRQARMQQNRAAFKSCCNYSAFVLKKNRAMLFWYKKKLLVYCIFNGTYLKKLYVSLLTCSVVFKISLHSRQQNYSSPCDSTCDFSFIWLPIFIIWCLI